MPLRILLFVFLLISVPFARAAAPGTPVSCDQLWSSHRELKSIDLPIYYEPNIPSEGAVKAFHMSELQYPDGSRFYANDMEQSHCFLDRILDATIQNAIRSGASEAAEAAKQTKDTNADVWADRLLARIDSHLAVAMGAAPDSTDSTGHLYVILSNLESLYRLNDRAAARPNAFVKLANRDGFSFPSEMSFYILVSYADHLGVKTPYFQKFIEEHRAKAAARALTERTLARRFIATLMAKSAATVGKASSSECLASNAKTPVTVGAELAAIFGSYIDSDWSFATSAYCREDENATRQSCTLGFFAHDDGKDEKGEASAALASAGFTFLGNPADGTIDTDTLECFQAPWTL